MFTKYRVLFVLLPPYTLLLRYLSAGFYAVTGGGGGYVAIIFYRVPIVRRKTLGPISCIGCSAKTRPLYVGALFYEVFTGETNLKSP